MEENPVLELELDVVKGVVRRAGEVIVRIGEEHYAEAAREADRNIVTKADLEADRLLKETLLKAFPEYGWLSEETRDDSSRLKRRRVWIVDPMDGTREFVMKTPEFVVSVALVEEGRGILGVIYNPVTEELFEASAGQGAKLNGRPVFCDHRVQGKPKVEVSRSDIETGKFAAFDSQLKLHPCGSIAYKLARLAAGQADSTLSVTPKNEWDIAAGVVLVAEAGGTVTDLSGSPYQFNRADTLVNGVVAGNQESYAVIMGLVDGVSEPT